MDENDKHAFNAKGAEAEQFIAGLCKDAYFAEFCFPNPYYAPGKELCDVLVVLGDIAMIWQIKNLKLVDGKFNEKEFNKNVRQCRGAKRRLGASGKLKLTNIEGKEKVIDPSKIKRYYLISAIEGGREFLSRYYDDNAAGNVHIFSDDFTRFATKHFDTVADLVEYLDKKEALMSTSDLTIAGSEADLAALYLRNKRTFGNLEDKDATMIIYDGEGSAEELGEDPIYKAKLEADKWSKGWDHLIEMRRLGVSVNPQEDEEEYRDEIMTTMMAHNRFERRYLGRLFFDGAREALEHEGGSGFIYRKYLPMDGVTYVFAYSGDENTPQAIRQKMLYASALLAREKFPQNELVVGILTEKDMLASPTCGYEWIGLKIPESEMKHYKEQLDLIKSMGTVPRTELKRATVFEYPDDLKDFMQEKKSGQK